MRNAGEAGRRFRRGLRGIRHGSGGLGLIGFRVYGLGSWIQGDGVFQTLRVPFGGPYMKHYSILRVEFGARSSGSKRGDSVVFL